jgi:hypothetical protein
MHSAAAQIAPVCVGIWRELGQQSPALKAGRICGPLSGDARRASGRLHAWRLKEGARQPFSGCSSYTKSAAGSLGVALPTVASIRDSLRILSYPLYYLRRNAILTNDCSSEYQFWRTK